MDEKRIIAALKNSAEELALEIARLPAEGTLWRPGEGEWSQHEILTHIYIADHYAFLPRLRAMATETEPFLPLVDEDALMKTEWNPERPREDLLKAFMADRGAEIDLLKAHNWDRTGRHERMGLITLGWVGQYALGHTWEHASQAVRARLNYTLRGPGQAG